MYLIYMDYVYVTYSITIKYLVYVKIVNDKKEIRNIYFFLYIKPTIT